jgi:hypothetical protein
MNTSNLAKYILLGIAGLFLGGTLMSCTKTDKQSSAGGGSSSQSVMSVKGAAR